MKLKPVRRSLGMLMLVDGALGLIFPSEYMRKLEFGIPLMDDILDYFAENPKLTQRVAIGEIVLGCWLTLG